MVVPACVRYGTGVVGAARPATAHGVERPDLAERAQVRRASAVGVGFARRLWLSPRTVETHVRHILHKLGLPPNADDHRRVRAVIAYLDR